MSNERKHLMNVTTPYGKWLAENGYWPHVVRSAGAQLYVTPVDHEPDYASAHQRERVCVWRKRGYRDFSTGMELDMRRPGLIFPGDQVSNDRRAQAEGLDVLMRSHEQRILFGG